MDAPTNNRILEPADSGEGMPATISTGAVSDPNEVEAQAAYQVALAALRLHRNRWTDALSIPSTPQF